MNRILLLAALLLTTAACASESFQRVPVPDQTQALSDPGLSRVYVCRMPQARGVIRLVRIYDGELEVGTIERGYYLCWERTPRQNPMRILYEGPVIDGGQTESIVDLATAAGEVVWLGVEIDRQGKPVVIPLDPETGRGIIADLEAAPQQD